MIFDRLITGGLALWICFSPTAPSSASPQEPPPHYAEHDDLSYYLAAGGQRRPIRSPSDWQQRRAHILAAMQEVMGPLPRPAAPIPLDVSVVEEHRDGGLIRRKLAYHADRADARVKAWLLLKPDGSSRRRAAVLCLHQTNRAGKDSPVGLAERPSMHYALELAQRGFVALAPDYPSFGENQHDFATDQYESGSMAAIYQNMRAVELLQALPEVDPERIGCIGHSLGGHNALFTAAFDDRIKAVVTSCGFTTFHQYQGGDLHGWSGPVYMPRIASRYAKSPGQMPFDFTEVVAALAPRPVFIVAPVNDDNFAVDGVRDVVAAARPVHSLFGRSQELHATYPDAGHDFPPAAREAAYAFLESSLQPTE